MFVLSDPLISSLSVTVKLLNSSFVCIEAISGLSCLNYNLQTQKCSQILTVIKHFKAIYIVDFMLLFIINIYIYIYIIVVIIFIVVLMLLNALDNFM